MKRILFIAPRFYEYPKLIKEEFERRGFVVDYYKSYPTSFFYKLSDFLHFKRGQRCIINHYTHNILNSIHSSYHCVFIIKASVLGYEFIEKLKSYVTAPFIQYIWDDLKFDRGAKATFCFFDKIFSYNPQDCDSEGLTLRTNFYSSKKYKKDKTVDLFFVASYKPNRLDFLNKILPEIKKNNLTCSFNMKCSIIMFVLTPKLWKYRQYMVFHPIKYNKMMEMLGSARAMIDVSEKYQNGLTTRPFEALHVDTKIITTNKEITNYDFYHNNNVLVIDEESPVIDINWINIPYKQIDERILNSYSVSGFVDDILG